MNERNQALAAVFRNMADELAARQANPHRVRAYRRAAESLIQLTEEIETLAEQDRLGEIPGIGKDLSAKITEYLRTGTIRSYEELKTPLPPAVAEWIQIPGMTEPAVRYLYGRLGIATLDDLAAMVRSHLLRTLPGITASDTEMLDAIAARQQNSRLP